MALMAWIENNIKNSQGTYKRQWFAMPDISIKLVYLRYFLFVCLFVCLELGSLPLFHNTEILCIKEICIMKVLFY